MDWFGELRVRAAHFGLNLVAGIPVGRYDSVSVPQYRAGAIRPETKSIVVLANGGDTFWRCFKAHTDANPRWCERDNPLDDFTQKVVENDLIEPLSGSGVKATTVFPFVNGQPTLNFMQLGTLAGLAGPSLVGVVVHPAFGPWIAFRAALLVDVLIDRPGDAGDYDPCPKCASRECIAACPASAVSFPNGWDIPRCLTYRVEAEPQCSAGCNARINCVLGREYRYPDDELAYHQTRALRAMRPYYETHIRPNRGAS